MLLASSGEFEIEINKWMNFDCASDFITVILPGRVSYSFRPDINYFKIC